MISIEYRAILIFLFTAFLVSTGQMPWWMLPFEVFYVISARLTFWLPGGKAKAIKAYNDAYAEAQRQQVAKQWENVKPVGMVN